MERGPEPSRLTLAREAFGHFRFEEIVALLTPPSDAEEAHLLGLALCKLKRHDEGIPFLEFAFENLPVPFEAGTNLAIALREIGRPAEARDLLGRLTARSDAGAAVYNALGATLVDLTELEAALQAFDEALAREPANAVTLTNLSTVALRLGQWNRAYHSVKSALALQPDHVGARVMLGRLLCTAGCVEEGLAEIRKVAADAPENPQAAANLLFRSASHPEWSGADIRREAERWVSTMASSSDQLPVPDRVRRIGFVSGDLYDHPVGIFLRPVLEHKPADVQVVLYANQVQHDVWTRWFRASADAWRDARCLGAEALARQIRADGIDVLFDLSGHTAGNRLDAFALRCAPVQVTWLGYSGTTGLRQMDYILVDPVVAQGSSDEFTERVATLPDSLFCRVRPTGLDFGPRPAPGSAESPIFGVFNNPGKFSEPCYLAWAELLRALPEARLTFKYSTFGDPVLNRRFRLRLSRFDVDPARVTLLGDTSKAEHWRAIQQVDVALDTFPYNGATTTTDCLWVGVPVVTLAGDRYSARMGASILSAAGLPELVARSPEEYVRLALDLVRDRARLDDLRMSLPGRLERSPLGDGPAFARNFYQTLDRLLASARTCRRTAAKGSLSPSPRTGWGFRPRWARAGNREPLGARKAENDAKDRPAGGGTARAQRWLEEEAY